MSEAADVQAEILKLARLLSRDPEELEYLADAPSADLRRLREQVTDVLFDTHGHALGRLAAASRLLPVGLTAQLAERALGPVLAARVAGMVEPSLAIDVATKLPTMFLADAATQIDPRRAGAVIAGIPPARIAEVTHELARRGDFATIGRFVGHLGTEATAAALGAADATSAVQIGAARRPRGRLPRFLAPAALVALLAAATSVVVTTSPGGGAAHPKPAMSSHAIARRLPSYWTVRAGDTFTQISEKTGLTVGQLEAVNPNTDPGALVPGQRLNLWLHPAASQPTGRTFWTVRSGESFASIAAKTGINLTTLEQLNPRLKPIALQPGDRLRLRESAA